MEKNEFKDALFKIEYELMRISSNAIYDGWDIENKCLTKILEAIDKLKEARRSA